MSRVACAPEAVTLEPTGWSHYLEAQVAAVAHLAPLAWYRERVESGELGAWLVRVAGELVGAVLWRVDHDGGRRCFVIAAAIGYSERFDLMGSVLPMIEAAARRQYACELVRFHTQRPGLVRRATAAGYSELEVVLRKELAA